jgi:very-short-patch-repair endonuclease/Cdc6-like AAA superfamily ATPase
MTSLQTRLLSLIEYVQQSARLRLSPQTDVIRHNVFTEYEHSISELPGIHLNVDSELDADEVWLVVDRLQEMPVPHPESSGLKVWLDITNNPSKEPTLLSHIEIEKLLEIGAIALPEESSTFDPKQMIALDSFQDKENIEDQFKAYTVNIWEPWAIEEKRRRRTISLYAKLFRLKQQLEGDIIDTQLEFAWGIGLSIWKMNGINVSYPLITKLVELSLNEASMAIEIRPRDIDPRIELDIYSIDDNSSVPILEKLGKEFFTKAASTISPFDPSTFEPLLRSAVTNLDPMGVYWPTQVKVGDRTLPKASDKLKITDTWVLFARPKSASVFIDDLTAFKGQIDTDDDKQSEILPKTVTAIMTEPATTLNELSLPAFRGISMVGNNRGNTGNSKTPQDLFFPMPFNDEQVQIIQLLECCDGVVVQGPPGTGKTHTIANIICHYLAMGKKVLVTSMKDPALSVLKEKLPEEIQSLAISVLTSERDGMKQFENAISKIASEVQRINRQSYSQEIARLEGTINEYHARLARVDREVGDWATKNLRRIELDGETLEPREAAEEVAKSSQEIFWLDDPISITSSHSPQFDDADIVQLRKARRALGEDLDYLMCKLPLIAVFPDSEQLLRVHQDLSHSTELKLQVESGTIPPMVDTAKLTFESLQRLSSNISNLKLLRQTFKNANAEWIILLKNSLNSRSKSEVFAILESLDTELEILVSEKRKFLVRPVSLEKNCDQNEIVVDGIKNLVQGKQPFWFGGLFNKSAEKKIIESIRIVSSKPNGVEDWKYILDYILFLEKTRNLLIRWNSLAEELKIPTVTSTSIPSELQSVANMYELYRKLKQSMDLEREIVSLCHSLFPTWDRSEEICNDDKNIDKAERIALHHLTQYRLAEVWVLKERFQKVLSGCSGRIVRNLQDFLENVLGNSAFSRDIVQAQWSKLMEELLRIHSLSSSLETVNRVTHQIEESGASLWSTRLRLEAMTTAVDDLLPSNWRQVWRLKRLHTYLNSIDARHELQRLAKLRAETEVDLAKAYQEIISKRTWLKLAENATPNVRAALKAYMSAIAKIGKGTGKRAVRYRQDARLAAHMANPAIPCWIMRHDRISESLPPQFGCFDLVIIDEASQSDLTALPAILRAQKILVVGDDKQVSPEGIGLEEEKIRNLMSRFLSNQVDIYRAQMSPDRSIYDLFKVVFAGSAVMLREHFRCVAPIIEYSKREFYNHELKALRLPKSSERLDPPLIDIFVEDGFRKGDINPGEARFIIDEIKGIANDARLTNRSIGVVSLLGDKQALKVWEMMEQELGLDLINRHQIACGDAKTFQGKERDIMFMSMVVSRNNAAASSRDTFRQRFNVAASRARDRMYLVRSVSSEDLSNADELRRGLIAHFSTPYTQNVDRVADLKQLCESPFEREVYDILTERGYRVIPQVPVGEFRIDMVVEGNHDARLAIECDGDRFHGLDQWENDMRRQRILERIGWRFWRCFASTFVMNRTEIIADLLQSLHTHGIEPLGSTETVLSPYVEQRRVTAFPETEIPIDNEL